MSLPLEEMLKKVAPWYCCIMGVTVLLAGLAPFRSMGVCLSVEGCAAALISRGTFISQERVGWGTCPGQGRARQLFYR